MGRSLSRNSTHKGSSLSEYRFTKKEEKKLLDTLGNVLSTDFPNPQRVGCPPREVLQSIASKKLKLKEAESWIKHIGHCSPCYNDFAALRTAIERKKRSRYLKVAAAIVIVVLLGVWAAVYLRYHRSPGHFTAVLDTRDQFTLRGDNHTKQKLAKNPMSLPRGIVYTTIYLQFGSPPGTYDVEVAEQNGTPMAVTTGTASMVDHVMALKVTLNLSKIEPGSYLIGFRMPGTQYQFCQLVVR